MIDKKTEESIDLACSAMKKMSWILSAPQVNEMLRDLAALLRTYNKAVFENWKPEDQSKEPN